MWFQSNLLLSSLAKRIETTTRRFFKTEKPASKVLDISHRLPPPCACPPYAFPDKKPCFDINNVMVERANLQSVKMIKPFLYENYFTREPCISGLFIPLDSPYLAYLAEHYSSFGDRWLAYEVDERTHEKKLIGLAVASKKHPWEADIYEDWGDVYRHPERYHLYFHSHCYRSPNIFKKYKVPYIYNIDVVVTTERLPGYGVGDLLVRTAVLYALEMRFPLIQVIATNSHLNKSCERLGMKREWSMKYNDFIDRRGRTMLSNRPPHFAVNIYVRPLNTADCSMPNPVNLPGLYQLFKKQYADKEYCKKRPGIEIFPPLPKCPTLKRR